MALSPGDRLGSFEVVGQLGVGGMGEVWRARDPQLGRDVALKVLPEAFTRDPERLARFEREAKLLAQLNHPNIAHIYGFERSGDVRALVMELVEGPTLAERLKAGAIPVTEALSLARQIAEALEEAHEKGIIHRDLKPQNIKASVDGKVKVLDFGLAKAFEATPISEISPSHLAHSPTLTLGGTREGVILGTAAYMSPEQAKGVPVDKRADIWAFGVVLWEMLTDRSLFAGDSVPDTLARVLQREIDFEELPKSTPPAIRRLLRRCLERQPKNRLHDIADARLVINDAMAVQGDAQEVVGDRTRFRQWLERTSWAISVLAVGALVMTQMARSPRAPQRRGQFEISLPAGRQLDAIYRKAVALSPDGSTLAVITSAAERPPADPGSKERRIELRAMDDSVFRPLAGSEGAFELAFSPDGRWLAFQVLTGFTEGFRAPYAELRKVPVEGGRAAALCKTRAGFGLAWSSDGWIAWAGPDGPIQRVRAGGGTVETLAPLGESSGVVQQLHPLALPGGRSWLFSAVTGTSASVGEPHRLLGMRSAGAASDLVLEGAADPRFVPPKRLLYADNGTIKAIRFDAADLKVSGDPTTIVDGVAQSIATGNSMFESAQAQYDVSLDGTIVYGPGGIAPPYAGELVWVDRTGRETPVELPVDPYLTARISADESRILLTTNYRDRQVEVYDPGRGTRRRLMTRGRSLWAIWGPGRNQVTFSSDHDGLEKIYVADVDGAADSATPLFDSPMIGIDDAPSSWSPDGRRLLFVITGDSSTHDVWLYEIGQAPKPYLATRFSERFPEFSPDGRWVAYTSNETGRAEVWVRPFEREGSAVQVSVSGGVAPAWSRDGKSIYYRFGERKADSGEAVSVFFRVSVTEEAETLRFGRSERLFEGDFGGSDPVRSHDLTAAGRFLLDRPHALDDGERGRRAELLFPKKLIVLLGHLGD